MAWNSFATPLIGKGVRWASRALHHGGSAFPGRVIEMIDPTFLARTLGRLPLGVVLVSGTNGKTTTTRMVASMLSDLGLKVFTNPTGSNFTRGVVSALLQTVSVGGRLDADIAVLELDEAYAVHFVRQMRPRYALLLNVMRDQLDRFGEIDNTARLLGHVAEATTGTVVLNREDPRIARLARLAPAGTEVRYFGLSDDLTRFFPSDDDMATTVSVEGDAGAAGAAPLSPSADGQLPSKRGAEAELPDGAATPSRPADDSPRRRGRNSLPPAGGGAHGASEGGQPGSVADASADAVRLSADVTLTAVGDHAATFLMAGADGPIERHTDVKLEGVYNLYNAAAALAVVRAVLADAVTRARAQGKPAKPRKAAGRIAFPAMAKSDSEKAGAAGEAAASKTVQPTFRERLHAFAAATPDDLIAAVARVTPAFGRGEVIDVNGSPTELLLVKNPMGFRLSLASFPPEGADTMIVINDEYADGRDMSWLWDVDFTSLRKTGVAQVSGVRAWDMALRLGYDQVPVGAVDTDIDAALAAFVKRDPGTRKHIYCTYTAMLKVRAALGRIANVADAGVGTGK